MKFVVFNVKFFIKYYFSSLANTVSKIHKLNPKGNKCVKKGKHKKWKLQSGQVYVYSNVPTSVKEKIKLRLPKKKKNEKRKMKIPTSSCTSSSKSCQVRGNSARHLIFFLTGSSIIILIITFAICQVMQPTRCKKIWL
jgi:hypothetical protein